MTKPTGANRLLHVYGREILDYEGSISEALLRLTELVSHEQPPARLVHNAVRRILADAGLVSLIFFPTREENQAAVRALFLRTEFGVDDTSTLRNRTIRNHLFHLDERLDKWAMESADKTFGRGMLGSRADAIRVGLNSEDILGIFDPASLSYAFLEDDLQVDDVVGEIGAVASTVRRRLRNLPWHEDVH